MADQTAASLHLFTRCLPWLSLQQTTGNPVDNVRPRCRVWAQVTETPDHSHHSSNIHKMGSKEWTMPQGQIYLHILALNCYVMAVYMSTRGVQRMRHQRSVSPYHFYSRHKHKLCSPQLQASSWHCLHCQPPISVFRTLCSCGEGKTVCCRVPTF